MKSFLDSLIGKSSDPVESVYDEYIQKMMQDSQVYNQVSNQYYQQLAQQAKAQQQQMYAQNWHQYNSRSLGQSPQPRSVREYFKPRDLPFEIHFKPDFGHDAVETIRRMGIETYCYTTRQMDHRYFHEYETFVI